MNKRPQPRAKGRPPKPGGRPKDPAQRSQARAKQPAFDIIERVPPTSFPEAKSVFRILIAVHRPRFRGRSERAAALEGWEVTALLNKQDPVGMVQKPPRPPDILVLSHDFGRQKDMAIFRAVQQYRAKGMKIVGFFEDCETAPESFPDSVPNALCDVCLTPPITAAQLRGLFMELYTQTTRKPAPPPRKSGTIDDEVEGDDD